MTLCLLAHFCLVRPRLRPKKAPALTMRPVADLGVEPVHCPKRDAARDSKFVEFKVQFARLQEDGYNCSPCTRL